VSGSLNSRVLRYKHTSSRPALDSNHIHVYNCDEAPGSTVLVDSGTGGKNLTLAGGEGTLYSLGAYRFGSAVPWVRCLVDNNTSPFASNNTLNLTTSQITIELVVAWTSLAAVNRTLVLLTNSSVTQSAWIQTTNTGRAYGGVYWSSPAYIHTVLASQPSVNRPYHIMFTYHNNGGDGWNATKLYVDGVYLGQSQVVQSLGNLFSMSNIILGGSTSVTGGSTQFYIRDVRISDIARDATYAFNTAKALLSL
jgi:Tfp pilus assembly protein PilX